MTVPATPERAKHHRFPAEIMSHGVWRYDRFCLSYRDVEERLFARGVIVTDAAIRQWCRTCGQASAKHAPASSAWRQVARGRGGSHQPWGTACPGACRGSRRPRAGHAGPPSPAHEGRAERLPHVAQRADRRAAGDHHGAMAALGRRDASAPAWGGTSPAPRSEPPRGTCPPTDAPTGATQAAGEVPRARPPVSRRVWAEPPPLPTATPSAFRP